MAASQEPRFEIFRTTDRFNIRVQDKSVAAWERTIEQMREASAH